MKVVKRNEKFKPSGRDRNDPKHVYVNGEKFSVKYFTTRKLNSRGEPFLLRKRVLL